MALQTGTEAPDFALPHKAGQDPVRLSDHVGDKPVVLLFFPLAFSGGCTKEICAVAERYDRWQALDAEVFGISVDSPFANAKFAEECGARFPILSDFNRKASRSYDVLYEDFFGLKDVSKRSVFVVGKDGDIAYSWVTEDAGVMPPFEEIEEAVKAAS